jgi:hypothetical protein
VLNKRFVWQFVGQEGQSRRGRRGVDLPARTLHPPHPHLTVAAFICVLSLPLSDRPRAVLLLSLLLPLLLLQTLLSPSHVFILSSLVHIT